MRNKAYEGWNLKSMKVVNNKHNEERKLQIAKVSRRKVLKHNPYEK